MINYIETHIVEHCNLKCRGCSHFSGLAPISFKDLESFQKEFDALGKLTNYNIPTIRIMGGEPLLHPHFIDFFIYARKIFQTSDIILVTNGILLSNLTDKEINILNDNNIALCVSNYGIKINNDKMNKFKHHYFHNKNDMYNISLDLSGSQNYLNSFNKCDIVNGGWYFFKNGRLYQCCIMANIDYFCEHFKVKIPYDLDDISININDHSIEEINNFLHTPHNVCKYCNTLNRAQSYSKFEISRGDIKEWTV